MKKILFKDKPNVNSRGQFSFLDDSKFDYSDSDGVSANLFDKFDKRDLYSIIQEDEVNKTICCPNTNKTLAGTPCN